MIIRNGYKNGNKNEKRIYVLPETGDEANRFPIIAGRESFPSEKVGAVYHVGTERKNVGVTALRFTEKNSHENLQTIIQKAIRFSVSQDAVHEFGFPLNVRLNYSAPFDKNQW